MQIGLAKGLDPGLDLRRYETLLEITDLLVRSQDLPHFFVSMSERLREIAAAEFVGFALHEPARNVLQMYPWHGGEPAPAPIEKSVEGTASGWTWQNQQPLVISDLESDTRFPATLQLLRDRGLRSHCWLPLTTAQKKLGTLGLGSGQLNAYADNDVGFLLRVAELVALAVENVVNREALQQGKEFLSGLIFDGVTDAPQNRFLSSYELSEPEQLLGGFFSASTVGLCILDDQLRYKAINGILAQMNGIPAEAHLGKTVGEIIGNRVKEIQPAFERVLISGEPVLNFELKAELPTRAELRYWIANCFPIRDHNGRVKQIGAAVVEVTEQKKLEQSLHIVSRTLCQERDRLQALLELNTTLVTHREPAKLFPAISEYLQRMIPHEHATISVHHPSTRTLALYPLDPGVEDLESGFATLQLKELPERAISKLGSKVFRGEELLGVQSVFVNEMLAQGIRSLCCVPLSTPKGDLGTLNLASSKENAFQTDDVKLLEQVASQVALALDNARAYQEIAGLKDKLAKERIYLQEEIRAELNFEEIIGDSDTLKRALQKAKTVAVSPATVLVLGETGTGKELIARAIHRMSARKDAAFVKINCAAIPTGLLESELFGHEKGSFTGAISQKIGRLELADKGTLFLDEVGDIPLELQPKLLRVLQDQEFERLGSTRTLKVNIRLIAATNRDLARSVTEREFRSDLYYRLNVFPIKMPTLRERRTDIPQLVRYFIQKFARELDKQIDTIPKEILEALKDWDWPGNVRELENFIERSVILSEGPELRVPLSELDAHVDVSANDRTLEGLERQHIVSVLRETGGVIAGPQGAAVRLGLKRTTLQSRIVRMGIVREEYQD